MNYWHRLPEHLRRDVVDLLDFESRCALRKSSIADKELVDSCPIYLKSVAIALVVGVKLQVTCWKAPEKTLRAKLDVAGDFLRILKHPKSEIGMLEMSVYLEGPRGREAVSLNQICSGLDAPSHPTTRPTRRHPLKVRRFSWQCFSDSYPTDAFHKIVGAMDPRLLQHVTVKDPVLFEKNRDLPEQLKSCRGLEIAEPIEFQEFMLNVDRLVVKLSDWSADDVVRMVKSFLSRNPPLGSFFDLTSTKLISSRDIFQKLRAPLTQMPRSMFRRPTHSHHFPMHTVEQELVLVSFTEEQMTSKVTAVVCRKGKMEDFHKRC